MSSCVQYAGLCGRKQAAGRAEEVSLMIMVTRLNGSELVINAELIETIEATPDTVVTLTTGRRVIVQESVAQVSQRTLAYRRAVSQRDIEAGC